MNIEKAIERLQNYPPGASPDNSVEFNQAVRLGIEALKQLIEERKQKVGFWRDRLPGETKE